jgi:hypothetical protein
MCNPYDITSDRYANMSNNPHTGPSHAHGTLGTERINKKIIGISNATNGFEESICRGIGMVEPMTFRRFEKNPSLFLPPPYLQPGVTMFLPPSREGRHLTLEGARNDNLREKLKEMWCDESPKFLELVNSIEQGCVLSSYNIV